MSFTEEQLTPKSSPDGWQLCPKCHGDGFVQPNSGGGLATSRKCPVCNGEMIINVKTGLPPSKMRLMVDELTHEYYLEIEKQKSHKMGNYKLETMAGENFFTVSEQAKKIASMPDFRGYAVEFDFNQIKCMVNKTTNLDWLYRDYCNAHLMEWRIVGADCLPEYEPEVLAELNRRKKLAEEKQELRRIESEAKDRYEQQAFEFATKGIELELANPENWNKAREANTDGYGKAALDYAEGWAKKMQIEIAKGKTIADCYDYTQDGLGFLGITGFQFGCAVSTLAQTWKHGEDLRKFHNKKWGREDSKGTANPALLTIG